MLTYKQMSSNINLIVAVSFGLFVPPRLLRAAKYGGINLHPSLLPEYRGAAPLHWTLLDRKNYTGVTLQTLDDKTFDAGIILAQTPLKDAYEIPKKCTVSELQDGLTPLATDMLVKSLREGRHLPPHRAVGWKAECDALGMDQVASQVLQFRLANTTDNNIKPRRADSLGSWAECLPNPKVEAPKITSEMRQFIMQSDVVQPTTNTVLRQRVLGPLWFMVSDNEGKMKRVTVEGQLEAQLADGRNLARRGVCRKVKFVRLITTKTDKAISTSIDQGADGRGCRTSSDFYFWTTDASEDIYLVAVNGLATLDAHPDACGTPTFSDADKLTEEDLQQHPGKHADSMMSIIKIGHLKMEGEKAKPAKAVLTKFASEVVSLDEFQNIQVASAWD